MIITKKQILSLIFVSLLAVSFLLPAESFAQADDLVWGGYYDSVQQTSGLGSRDPREMIVGIIRIALGFLGIMAVTIIILAGFKVMLSGGNEDKAAEAKAMLFNGVVGLIIILASLSLANFVINAILNATQIF